MTFLKRSLLMVLMFSTIAFIGLRINRYALAQSHSLTSDDTPDDGVTMAVEGLVRDVACPMQNHKSTATHFNLECARACAKAGSPLIILTKNDEMYFPMTNQMPDVSQREKLAPYVGEYVRVVGLVRRRHGTRTIVIDTITELKDVKLDTKLGSD
jgi:hypothetical protein